MRNALDDLVADLLAAFRRFAERVGWARRRRARRPIFLATTGAGGGVQVSGERPELSGAGAANLYSRRPVAHPRPGPRRGGAIGAPPRVRR